ncbi:MAG: extracellular solute-binding protein [Bacillota bacterium]|nr:extracellular solute-binding protein [Bacillota bacterium]
MNRVISFVLFIGMFIGLFTGCRMFVNSQAYEMGMKSTNTMEVDFNSKPSNEKITLTYMTSQNWVTKAEQELGAKFERETGIKVKYQIIPSDQYQNILMTKLNVGECADLFGSESGKAELDSFLNIENNGVDLSNEEWAKKIDPIVAEQLTSNGKLYGMPLFDASSCWEIVYNKKIFQRLGLKVPSSYNEFKNACKKIMNDGVTPIYECVSDGWHHVLWFPEIGGRYQELDPGLSDKLNNNQTSFAASKTMFKALSQLQELVTLGYFGENYLSNTFADTEKNMASGKYAMTVYNQGLPKQIEKISPDTKAEDFGFFVIPLVDNQTLNFNPAGPSIFLYSGSKHKDIAKQYLSFLTRSENLQYIIDNTDSFSDLPFTGVKKKYSAEIKKFYNSYPKHGTVYQTKIKFFYSQWMDIGRDLSSMFTGLTKPEDVLINIDKRRFYMAKASKDQCWTGSDQFKYDSNDWLK